MMTSRREHLRIAGLLIVLVLPHLLCASPNGADGKRQLLGKLKPRHSGQIAASPWGIQIGSLEKDHLARAAEIGIKWTRLQANWKEIEPQRGVYEWAKNDQAFAYALENNITPFVCLAGSNPIYCKQSAEIDARQKEIYGSSLMPPTEDPEALAAWLKFVRVTVERYKNRIHYWEIWNEPNHPHYWGAPVDGTEYGHLVRETAKAIKAVDPTAKLIGGALAGLNPEFTDKFLANGTAGLIDIITFHNYGELPEERIYKALEVWDVINKHNSGLELWQGECGYPSHSSTRDYRCSSPWGLNVQAKWLLRQSFTDVYFCRTTMSNYFKLVHMGGRGELPKRSFLTSVDSLLGFPTRGGARVKSVGVNEKCLLSNPDLAPKPAFFAYQNLCAVFDGKYKAVKSNSKVVVVDQGIFYGIGREDDAFPSIPLVSSFKSKDGLSLLAYWLPWHPQEIVKDATVTLKVDNATFKEPVLIDLLDGEVYNLSMKIEGSMCVFENIPMTDYPFVIAEKSQVTIGQ